MNVHVLPLNRSFEVSESTAAPFTQTEMARALPTIRSRTLAIDFQRDIDGPQTAARLIKETLASFGASWTSSVSQCDAFIWIQAGVAAHRFAFVVADPIGSRNHVAGQCGPRELTATIMTSVCEYFQAQADQKSTPNISNDEIEHGVALLVHFNRELGGACLAKGCCKIPILQFGA